MQTCKRTKQTYMMTWKACEAMKQAYIATL